MKKQMKKVIAAQAQRGFTLIEVMVVIVILGVLAAIIVPNVMGKVDSSKIKSTKISMQTIAHELDAFKLDNGRYPTTQEGLDALMHKPANAKSYPEGGYLGNSSLKDSWGNDFQYVAPGTGGHPFDLYSFGADGKEGGDGNDADIYYEK
jgi:general secretion pathway protein G